MLSGSLTPQQTGEGLFTSLKDCCCRTAPETLQSGAGGLRVSEGAERGIESSVGAVGPSLGSGSGPGVGTGEGKQGVSREKGGKEKSEEACVCV